MNDDNNVKVGVRKLHLSVTRMKKLRSEIKAGEGGANAGITSGVPFSVRPWNAHEEITKLLLPLLREQFGLVVQG